MIHVEIEPTTLLPLRKPLTVYFFSMNIFVSYFEFGDVALYILAVMFFYEYRLIIFVQTIIIFLVWFLKEKYSGELITSSFQKSAKTKTMH